MGSHEPLVVRVGERAQSDIQEIWRWNALQYGADHADAYIDLLLVAINSLGDNADSGSLVPEGDGSRYLIVKKDWSRSAHGHVVVYETTQQFVNVLRVYHTAQDWQSHLKN